jgi:hypothetical protein
VQTGELPHGGRLQRLPATTHAEHKETEQAAHHGDGVDCEPPERLPFGHLTGGLDDQE